MHFQVYDSLTRKKQPLLVSGQKELKIYVCGPTVYDHIHVGNARTFVTFMLLVRYLRFCGIDVTSVSNITDINDKIYKAAKEQGISSEEMSKKAVKWYLDDTNKLGLGRPDIEPQVTTSMASIIKLIEELIAKGFAYESGGDVYFSVKKYSAYGKLSNRTVEDMLSGSRDDLDSGEHKKDSLDFVLWKAKKKSDDTSWSSPWGEGRPGWHIECSAMAQSHLGDTFDVHAGGLDLIFPHHENEVAQSKCAGHGFARLWMHGGLLEAGEGEKMSKSLGNFARLNDVLDEIPAWQLVLFFLSASYRNPLAWTDKGLHDAAALGGRITETLRRVERYLGSVETRGAGDEAFADSSREWEGIHEALRDDFNTAEAVKELNGILYDVNTAVDEHATPQLLRNQRQVILELLQVFGLEVLIPESVDVTAEAQELIDQRDAAREAKDFERSDQLRAQLEELGYVVRDTDMGTQLLYDDEEVEDEEDSSVEAGS